MKRIISLICAAALACSLTGCSSSAQSTTDYSGQTLTGKVVAIDGSMVALQLGELSNTDAEDQQEPDKDEEPDVTGSEQAPVDKDEKPDTDSSEQTPADKESPPDKPEGEDGVSEGNEPPDKPEEDSSAEDGNEPPELPDSSASPNGDGKENPPDKSNGQGEDMKPQSPGSMETSDGFVANGTTAIVGISGAEILSEAGDVSSSEIVVGAILEIEMNSQNEAATVTILSTGDSGSSIESVQGSSANTIDTDGEYTNTRYSSEGDDENALRVDGAKVSLYGIIVKKTAGSSSNTENGDFYGVNAALLATDGAAVSITGADVTSSAQNGNGVFSYGEGTTVTISDSAITTTGDNSGGIQTTGGGTTNAIDLTVETSGSSSAAIRSDRGGGIVNVDGGTYTSNGYNSPAVYSTADISVKNADLTANQSEALVIEGDNSITLENCNVSGNMSDDKGTSSDENVHCVMIYQSMSGDANVGTSSFSMTGGSLLSHNGDVFYVTNTACTIDLSGVEIKDEDASGHLMNICGNSASHGWGTAGENGAQVKFTASGQVLEGDIIVDSISTLDMVLSDSSDFVGTVNIVDNAQGGDAAADNAVVTVESGSIWTLTGDCAISSLNNNGTISFNGFSITLADGTVLS